MNPTAPQIATPAVYTGPAVVNPTSTAPTCPWYQTQVFSGVADETTCGFSLMNIFMAPGQLIGKALNIKHTDMIDAPYITMSLVAWGGLAYLLLGGRK